ncbi:dATP/dGTP diphosphohydrolase domain-containing protein [Mycolicibacterium septicum]|uniref:dATP/dGTP diphosphohydrolase domain-containing protein n=1 Tax=Mycolicibacterium septicum TaxID=98668 RepID=UPI001AF389EB|nr:dATP/dGTP diphosphohydrolase domain-containing protein [Mycolicibacterium septicum]QRY51775.1 hypothetical protein JVX95_31115 [Mycolicibacterium septicum]
MERGMNRLDPDELGAAYSLPALKDTNPKDAIGVTKAPFSTVPAQVVAEAGLALLEGAVKYGRHNYRAAGVRASVYYDAAFRHLAAWWEGQDIDPDSGLPHVVKAIACLMVLRDGQIQENWVDDRPPKTPGDWVQELNAKAKTLLERYPNAVPPYTEVEQ